MKRIALLGLVCFALSGCGDDKVISDEMFAGDWKCEVIDYKSTWDKSSFGEFKPTNEKQIKLLSFKYENNSLYLKASEKEDWKAGSLIEEYNNKTTQEEDDFLIDKITKSLKKISNNKFITTYESEIIVKDEKYNSLNEKLKNEATCTRIK
ncbi:hypothetical protein B6D16_01070 [Gilliamella apicola]|uniref:hypothetical protein n=1 Tax=Gilliamella apicola TaxID=1196095 RepID=UPI000A344180|nr:hypothetical protein [Gilliamella apicola]QHJ81299.1 MAG: hypothetical protein [Bacteriophage sp.]OTP97218.1 hypothetical protein B6D05_01615 [Gilliamella apicola]OTQ19295.1 hypothetical protein B6D15_02530 [Gilliamella apicola]OTQ21706.1 hypothetical protein B6D16_01070 [Gilliamella apicola]OTQ23013.1 hypothetical protein B6D04_10910 [Gilliamella apicola]